MSGSSEEVTVVTGIATEQVPSINFSIASAQVNSLTGQTACILADAGSGSTLTPNVPFLATSVAAVTAAAGAGSNIDLAYQGYRSVDTTSPVLILPTTVTSGVPDIADAFTGLGDIAVSTFVSPYSSQAAITAFDTALNDTTGRWSNASQLFGMHMTARQDTTANLEIYAQTVNSKYSSGFVGPIVAGTSVAYQAGVYGALVNLNTSGAPGRPLQFLQVPITAPALGSTFSRATRNALLAAGLSTYNVDSAGEVFLDSARTLYKTNANNISDTTFSRVTRMYVITAAVTAVRAALDVYLTGRFELLPNGSQIPGGTFYTTPDHVLGTAIAEYYRLAAQGLVTDPDQFAADASASITPDGNGVALALPFTVPGELNQIYFAITIAQEI